MQPKAKQFSFEQKKDADEVVEKVRQREEINFFCYSAKLFRSHLS